VISTVGSPPFSRVSVNIQGTFREYSGNTQGTFREHSVNIQWTFSEKLGNIQGTSRKYSGNIQETFRELPPSLRWITLISFRWRSTLGAVLRERSTWTPSSSHTATWITWCDPKLGRN
jgi:hypothetical protein